MATLEFFLRCFLQKNKFWRISRRKGEKLTAGELRAGFCSSRGPANTCFSAGCHGYYEKNPTKYVCCEARHLNMCFNASSSLLFWTQILQLLCAGMYISNRLWRVKASVRIQCRCCFALLVACRCPGFDCLWASIVGNWGCKNVVRVTCWSPWCLLVFLFYGPFTSL